MRAREEPAQNEGTQGNWNTSVKNFSRSSGKKNVPKGEAVSAVLKIFHKKSKSYNSVLVNGNFPNHFCNQRVFLFFSSKTVNPNYITRGLLNPLRIQSSPGMFVSRVHFSPLFLLLLLFKAHKVGCGIFFGDRWGKLLRGDSSAPLLCSVVAYGGKPPGADMSSRASGNSFSFGAILQ